MIALFNSLLSKFGLYLSGRPYMQREPVVRVWRLGSLDHRLFPTEASIQLLADILATNTNGGDLDIIWGPDLDVVQLNGRAELNVVAGPGIRVTTDGDVVKVDLDADPHPAC